MPARYKNALRAARRNLRWRFGLVPQIMVSGVMRSGTTLLQRIVAHGVGDVYRSEFHLPAAFIYRSSQLADLGVPLRSEQAELAQIFEQHWKKEGRPRRFVVKDPLLTAFLEPFLVLCPRVKVVVTSRDSRDTITSILDVRARLRDVNDPAFITSMSDLEIADMVLHQNDILSRLRGHPRVHHVDYEDLARRDPASLDALSRFLHAPMSYDIPNLRDEFPSDNAFVTNLNGEAVSDEKIGRYKKSLPAELLTYLESKT